MRCGEDVSCVEKQKIMDCCAALQADLWQMSDQIFDFAEVGLEEFQSSALLEEYLEKNGFVVEKGAGGLATAFRAVWQQGEGGPSFGLLCEYDALKGMGHGCGHHMQGPSIIGAALILKKLYGGSGKPFKIVVYGTPAEETVGGKTIMMEHGCFRDIDIALMMHGAPKTGVDVKSMADNEYTVEFHGVSAHAAMTPEKGRSALDAALLSFNGIEFLREHVEDGTRMHYTVVDAGGPANVVPEKAVAQYALRSYRTEYLNQLAPRFANILKGACLMTGTTYEIKNVDKFYGKIPCLSLNELVMTEAKRFGAPRLAPPRQKTGSTDFGIILYNMPGTCIRVAFVPEGSNAHSQAFLDAGKTPAAHRAVVYGAEILAAVCGDILDNPELLKEMWKEFRERKKAETEKAE